MLKFAYDIYSGFKISVEFKRTAIYDKIQLPRGKVELLSVAI